MNLDEMKSAWQSQQFTAPGCERSDTWRRNRVSGFSEQLKASYRFNTIMVLVFVPFMSVLGPEAGFPLWLTLWMIAYFLIMGTLTGMIWADLRTFDFGILTLTEALDSVVKLRRHMMRNLIIGITLGLPTIVMLFVLFGLYGEEGVS